MKIVRSHFIESVGRVSPPLYVAAVSRALDGAGAVLSSDEAGQALAASTCPDTRFGLLGQKPVVGCEIKHGAQLAWLPAPECFDHRGVGEWLPRTLGAAFMLPVELAATLAHATRTVPVIETVGIVTGEGFCSGQLVLSFPAGAVVTVFYGQRFSGAHFTTTAHAVAGDGLFAIGHGLREADMAEEAAQAVAVAGESPVGQVLH